MKDGFPPSCSMFEQEVTSQNLAENCCLVGGQNFAGKLTSTLLRLCLMQGFGVLHDHPACTIESTYSHS